MHLLDCEGPSNQGPFARFSRVHRNPAPVAFVCFLRESGGTMLVGLSVVFAVAALICTIIVLIDAFQDSVLKGLLCLLCGLYYIYYALFEFDHDRKWLIVIGSLLGGGVSGLFRFMAMQ
jgi:uncharacterized membrane protein YhaH (DUF805 family)